jgi:type II secretory pathway component PulF
MFNLLPEIFWMLLMLGAIVATIVVAVKEKKARAAAAKAMLPIPMMGGDEAVANFEDANSDPAEFNMDSFK